MGASPSAPARPRLVEERPERGSPGGVVVDPERSLAAILFTDIVGSTEKAAALGDRVWRGLLHRHHAAVRRELRRHGGREIATAGDGFLSVFDHPAAAIVCACAIRDALRKMGIEIRGGIHAGQVERSGPNVGGIAVHIGARVAAAAEPGDVLVSGTVRDLEVGSGFQFVDRGIHQLKGVPGEWRLFAVASCPPDAGDLARDSIMRAAQARGLLAAGIGFVVLFVLAGLYVGIFRGEESPPEATTADGAAPAMGRRVMEELSSANGGSAAGDADTTGAAGAGADEAAAGDSAGTDDRRPAERFNEAPSPPPETPSVAARPPAQPDRERPTGRAEVEPRRTAPAREPDADLPSPPRPRPPAPAAADVSAPADRSRRQPGERPPNGAARDDLPAPSADGRPTATAADPRPPLAPAAAVPAGPPPAPPRPAPEPEEADPEQDIRRALSRLQRAIVSEDLGALRQIWPSLGETEARNFEHWFDAAREIRARFDVLSLEPVDNRMRATLQTTYDFYNESTGRAESQTVRQVYEFERRGGEWVVASGR